MGISKITNCDLKDRAWQTWRSAGKNLERFSKTLFFDLERHRAQHSDELLDAIRRSTKGPFEFSQIYGRLCSAAGVHAVLYPSTRDDTRRCLALMPQNWRGSDSFVELQGPVPDTVQLRRLGGK